LVHYYAGVENVASGDFEQAIDRFNASLSLQPDFRGALVHRAHARLDIGELDLAISDFHQLVRTYNDQTSMACLGYCFNLKQLTSPAILWYEKALANGEQSQAVLNNLGATYLLSRDRLSNQQRYLRSEDYLLRALQLSLSSQVVRLNLIRLETAKAYNDSDYIPSAVWEHAAFVLNANPEDPHVKSLLGAWYAMVLNREAAAGRTQEGHPSTTEAIARKRFAELVIRQMPDSVHSGERLFARKYDAPRDRGSAARFYIEPTRRK
jgi:tetratricopeptide (TPR) repeat protein